MKAVRAQSQRRANSVNETQKRPGVIDQCFVGAGAGTRGHAAAWRSQCPAAEDGKDSRREGEKLHVGKPSGFQESGQ